MYQPGIAVNESLFQHVFTSKWALYHVFIHTYIYINIYLSIHLDLRQWWRSACSTNWSDSDGRGSQLMRACSSTYSHQSELSLSIYIHRYRWIDRYLYLYLYLYLYIGFTPIAVNESLFQHVFTSKRALYYVCINMYIYIHISIYPSRSTPMMKECLLYKLVGFGRPGIAVNESLFQRLFTSKWVWAPHSILYSDI